MEKEAVLLHFEKRCYKLKKSMENGSEIRARHTVMEKQCEVKQRVLSKI
jgi:hypothetical protein